MRIFLDTNVLLDFVQDGRPGNDTAKVLFQLLRNNDMEPYVTTQSIIDLVYIAANIDRGKTMRFVNYLLSVFNVRPIDCMDLRFALNSGHPDFEDSAQIVRALDEECDIFLTSDEGIIKRNVAPMLVMTPEQFIYRLKNGS